MTPNIGIHIDYIYDGCVDMYFLVNNEKCVALNLNDHIVNPIIEKFVLDFSETDVKQFRELLDDLALFNCISSEFIEIPNNQNALNSYLGIDGKLYKQTENLCSKEGKWVFSQKATTPQPVHIQGINSLHNVEELSSKMHTSISNVCSNLRTYMLKVKNTLIKKDDVERLNNKYK